MDGQRLTDFDFNLFFMLLINAGGDTTRNLVAAGICRDGPSGGAGQADGSRHCCRRRSRRCCATSPVIVFFRTATKDTELHGVPVKAGDRAAMFYPSANRDEARSPTRPLRYGRRRTALGLWRRRYPLLPRREPRPGGGLGDLPEVLSRM